MSPFDPTFRESFEFEGVEPAQVTMPTPFPAAEIPREEEPEETAGEETVGRAIPEPIPRPVLMRPVSGRYRGQNGIFTLELRVDVDGTRPLGKVSGDFFRNGGATQVFAGSFIVPSPVCLWSPTQVTITGTGEFTSLVSAPQVKITIARVPLRVRQAPAVVQFMTVAGELGATFTCSFASRFFRTVEFERDRVSTADPFISYNTGSLPSGGPARTLSVSAAYAEAGIEILTSGLSNVVPFNISGQDALWNDDELHNAMVSNFSLWKDVPQWKVWLFLASKYVGSGVLGIMFDQKGKQRQGCAVFHDLLTAPDAATQREELYCHVHELGHCFNLMHSFQKSYALPLLADRPGALSWMNYPQYYAPQNGQPVGSSAFWSAFPFAFDTPELIHLRHAFRDNIIMGGNNFTIGAALADPLDFADPDRDESGLRLQLEAPRSFAMGEPVKVEIKLYRADGRTRRVHADPDPSTGMVEIGLRKPGGEIVVYEPMMWHCTDARTIQLTDEQPSIYRSAYIGYGKDGFYFDQAGTYQVKAIYHAPDGSQILSNLLTLKVRAPMSREDEEVADLFYGEDLGQIVWLQGSESEFLKSGNDALEKVIVEHGAHPLAVWARFLRGMSVGRAFKTFRPGEEIKLRKPQMERSAELLASVVDVTQKGAGVDNFTLGHTFRRLVEAQRAIADDRTVKATAQKWIDAFKKKELKAHVMKSIEAEVKTLVEERRIRAA